MINHSHEQSVLAQHLKSLLLMRWLVLALLLAGLALAHSQLHLVLEYTVLLSLLSGFAALNVFAHWRLRQVHPLHSWELVAHLLVDLAGITLMLYFVGGATNPFVSYLLIPLCIAAIALPAPTLALLTIIAIACYGLLLSHYIPADAMAPGHHHGNGPSLHTWGMGVNFFISACLMTAFLSRMSSQLKQKTRLLQSQREQVLHAEQITGIATLAAGTAHDLGTPLSTMKIAADELANAPLPDGLNAEAAVIVQQIRHCQSLLQRLRQRAQQSLSETQIETPVETWLETLVDQWRLLNPHYVLRYHSDSASFRRVALRADQTLQQSLHNLLDNAAVHSQADIDLDAYCTQEWLTLCIHDTGNGIPADIKSNWGKPFNSSREDGMGLGVYLSNATLERHGGELRLESAGLGSKTWVRIPVSNCETQATD